MPKYIDPRTEKPKIYLDEHKLKTDDKDYGLADELWNFSKFKSKLKIVRVRREPMVIEFDMIGIGAAFANAFRRIMLSEVPSMAIEKVHIYNNTTIIQDEVRLFHIKTRRDDYILLF